MGEKTRRRWPLIAAAAVLVAALVIAGMVTIFVRGGVAHPADRARAEAAAGYERWAVPFEDEAAQRQAALQPELGEPIGEVWEVNCYGVGPGGPGQVHQECYLSVLTTYAAAWPDPTAGIDDMIAVLKGTATVTGPGEKWSPRADEFGGPLGAMVATAGKRGSVVVHEPGRGPALMREVGEPDVFPGSSLEKSTMELAETPEQSWTVEVKRTVKVSRTNIGCIPVPVRGCETLMREAAMPQIEGFS